MMDVFDFHKTEYLSEEIEVLVGHGSLKIYGKPDCPFVLRHPSGGSYSRRVLFWCEEEALAAGYRPCAVCMKERHQLWKAGWLMPRTLEVVEPEYFDGPGLCTVCLTDDSRKTLKLEMLRYLDSDCAFIYRSDWSCYELAQFKIGGDYCIANLLSCGETWGRVVVWDYVRDRVVHMTAAPHVRCSALFDGQVISMYQANHWYEVGDMDFPAGGPSHELDIPNGALWYSAIPLGVIDPDYEPDLYLLPLPVPDGADDDPNCFDIRAEGGTPVFRAGAAEYRLNSL